MTLYSRSVGLPLVLVLINANLHIFVQSYDQGEQDGGKRLEQKKMHKA